MENNLQNTQPDEVEGGLSVIKSIYEIAAVNRPIIEDKVSKALNVLYVITVVNSEETDKFANDVLVKCNNTIPIIEGLRKEYTSKIDQIKKDELVLENALKKEMDRVKLLRNAYANEIAQANAEAKKKIAQEKNKAQEVARVKSAMMIAVETGIANRISQGEQAIATLFNGLTLENFDAEVKKLDFAPNLKSELFTSFIRVTYDSSLISPEEFEEICLKAEIHFNYNKCNTEYISEVTKIVIDWKAKLPAKKKELEEIAKADTAKAEQLKLAAAKRAEEEATARKKALEEEQKSINNKAQTIKQEEIIDTEFEAQVATQSIPVMTGVRTGISYRLANEDELIRNPGGLVEVLAKAWLHIVTDDSFKGFIKRQKSGFPKMDARGQVEYIDAVQDVLTMLARVKDRKGLTPDIPGLVITEEVTTIAKS